MVGRLSAGQQLMCSALGPFPADVPVTKTFSPTNTFEGHVPWSMVASLLLLLVRNLVRVIPQIDFLTKKNSRLTK